MAFPLMAGLALGGLALGALRGNQQAKRQAEIEDQTRKMHAAQVRYSPWTGRQSFTPIQYAQNSQFDAMLGGGLQGAGTGLALGQGINSMQQPKLSPWEQMQMDNQRRTAEQMDMYNQGPGYRTA